ncbi:MAG: MBOAT family protein [Oscillospiraceae bacterium]|jgi:D-alanyl-lipoteichoic acid acyltransferase DltB (MBOAT superfamily)|nr:MBOAT family protein [Oscillospiraceae bacterium]
MSINSLGFLAFLAAAAALYYLAPRRARWCVLLAAGAAFYLSYDARMALFLAGAILTAYGGARLLARLEARGARLAVLWAALAVNLAPLVSCKYLRLDFMGLLAPLGISFYVMQTAGYLIDVYSEKYPPERKLARYALFMSFFPQLIQGPIHRYDAMAEQLFEGHRLSADNLRHGIQLILWGLLKKALIADLLGGFVGRVFNEYGDYGGAVIFLGVALYCLQLYADFSGGIDVARGAAELFGIEMAVNFRRPYLAASVTDFWHRWHISLGEFMRDYVFYPLALSRPFAKLGRFSRQTLGKRYGKLVPTAAATVITFLVVGVWQGPGWQNAAYGLWNGGLVAFELFFAGREPRGGAPVKARAVHVLRVLRTLLLVCIGRYFSRAGSLTQSLAMLGKTVSLRAVNQLFDGTLGTLGLSAPVIASVLATSLLLLFVSLLEESGRPARRWLSERRPAFQFLVVFIGLVVLIGAVYINSDYIPSEFIYGEV